mmetsp:Transcript_36982/g.84644  ORF Transcript_36982/g.84644 Transcript_36982/m.84644 type:complete len:280 (+) Transcript_36982:204-1043(+)
MLFFFSNRSAAYVEVGLAEPDLAKRPNWFSKALADGEQATQLKPDWWKSWSRRGKAEYELGRLEDCIVSYNKALSLKPGGDPHFEAMIVSARQGLNDCTATDMAKLSPEQLQEKLRSGYGKLSLEELQEECKKSKLTTKKCKRKEDYVEILVQADCPSEPKKPTSQAFCSCFGSMCRKVFPTAVKRTEGERLLQRRQRVAKKYSGYSAKQLRKKAKQNGLIDDQPDLDRDALFALVIQHEIDRYQSRWDPAKFHKVGIFCVVFCILCVFLVMVVLIVMQ